MEGRFETAETVRDPDRHPLKINLNAGDLLNDILDKVRLERIIAPDFSPRIISFTDAISQTTKSVATPGGIFKVTGERLRIGGRRPEEVGLYLRAGDGTETRVEVLLDNEPGVIVGQLPDTLATGSYKLVVKTQVGSGGQYINEVRTGASLFPLTVK
jgi:hypothetical protein